MKKLFVCLSLVVFVLSGCGKKNVKPAEYTAEEAALAYFESIYNTKNFKRALTLASPKTMER